MSPATPRSRREERKAETRRELIESAARVFADRGFHRASLEHIAGEAGYTTGAIYFHFGGKDELFLAVFEAYAMTRVAEVADVYQQATGTPAKRLRALADHWMARQAADPDFFVVALEFFVHSLRHPELREAMATRQAAVRLALQRIIEDDAEQAGVTLPLAPAQVATALRELGIGLAQAKLLDPQTVPDSLYGDFVELFYGLVFPEDRTPAPDHEETRA